MGHFLRQSAYFSTTKRVFIKKQSIYSLATLDRLNHLCEAFLQNLAKIAKSSLVQLKHDFHTNFNEKRVSLNKKIFLQELLKYNSGSIYKVRYSLHVPDRF